jgi:hypothetical protein
MNEAPKKARELTQGVRIKAGAYTKRVEASLRQGPLGTGRSVRPRAAGTVRQRAVHGLPVGGRRRP